MAEDIFDGLPPPLAAHDATVEQERPSLSERRDSSALPMPSIRPPALKSALKRDKPPESPGEGILGFPLFYISSLDFFLPVDREFSD